MNYSRKAAQRPKFRTPAMFRVRQAEKSKLAKGLGKNQKKKFTQFDSTCISGAH